MDILNLLFPKICLNCKTPGKYICSLCLAKVPDGGWNQKKIYSLWKYDGVIRKAILALKYKFALQIAQELSDVSCAKLKMLNNKYFLKNTVLIPVPLHTKRHKWRGFNQAEEVGRGIAFGMGWRFELNLIIKIGASKPQAELARKDRLRNLSGKFAVNPASKGKIDPCSTYLIFDDVATTGSTIKEITKVLKRNGAKEVYGLTIAG